MAYSLSYNTAYEGDPERLGYNSSERRKRREERQRERTRRTDKDAEVGKATPAMALSMASCEGLGPALEDFVRLLRPFLR